MRALLWGTALSISTALILGSVPARAITVDEARHLLTRATFAATTAEADALRPLDRGAAIDRLLATARTEPSTTPPGWTAKWVPLERPEQMNEAQRKVFQDRLRDQSLELKAWWFAELANTPAPLTETMTLFWHGHFTSSLQKVRPPLLIYRQNQLFRKHALGNFGALLAGVVHDPAMLIYLDNVSNRKGAPNENLARELLELFTLGEGRYSEADIKETARALTGFALDPETGEFRAFWARHDIGPKTILGRTGEFTGDDVVKLLLDNPRTAELIVEKLWVAFVSPAPDKAEVKRLSKLFRDGKYEMKPLLRALWLTDAFWAPENRASLVKSPVELLVGAVRGFGIKVPDGAPLAQAARRMGQDLLDPPNVKGWPGGTTWINSDTYLVRQELLRFVTSRENPAARAQARDGANAMGGDMAPGDMAPGGMAAPAARRPAQMGAIIDRWVEALPDVWTPSAEVAALLVPLPPVDVATLDPLASGALVRRLLNDPVYQLK